MGLDNIELSPWLHRSLFNNKLIDLKASPNPKKIAGALKIDYLGGNEKNITLITNDDQHKFLDDKQLKFLSGLISACNITMADIAVVNMHNNREVTYTGLSDVLSCRKVLCFGVSPEEIGLPFDIPFYQVQTFQEVTYIFCPRLDYLQDNPDGRKQLWGKLQQIFTIPRKR